MKNKKINRGISPLNLQKYLSNEELLENLKFPAKDVFISLRG